MGSWFTNIHIRKQENLSEKTVMDHICAHMEQRRYVPCDAGEDADAVVAIVTDDNSQWVSVYSQLFVHDDPASCAAIATPMSAQLHTDVIGISCFDSDYLYMNLINSEEQVDAWIGIGRGADVGIKRRSGLAAWKKKVSDYPTFAEGAKSTYVCAEEFLSEVADCLGLPLVQSAASLEYLKDLGLEQKASYLYFKLPEDAPKTSVELQMCYLYYALPCVDGKKQSVMALNCGVEAKGLRIYFVGPYVEQEEIRFSDVRVDLRGLPSVFAELTKTQLSDGQWAYVYHDPEFPIPAAVPNWGPKEKRHAMEQERMIHVTFVPHGNPRKMLDITVVLVPDANPENQAIWNVWRLWGSKGAYIAHYNKIWKRVRSFEVEEQCRPLLREEDFD